MQFQQEAPEIICDWVFVTLMANHLAGVPILEWTGMGWDSRKRQPEAPQGKIQAVKELPQPQLRAA